MAEYIERERYLRLSDIKVALMEYHGEQVMSKYLTVAECKAARFGIEGALYAIEDIPAADVAPVVRCQNCIHVEPLDRNCELNTCVYMHCKLGRGEEEKNVWHKYKKYYKDYSLVYRDGFCDEGERMDGE